MNDTKKPVPSSGAREFQEKIIRSERPSRMEKPDLLKNQKDGWYSLTAVSEKEMDRDHSCVDMDHRKTKRYGQ